MKLKSIRIKNFRTIQHEELIEFHNRTTIVGANSSGKTNILRAIQMLFTGLLNRFDYTTENDLTFGVLNSQTVLIGTFSGDPSGEDEGFYTIYKEMLRNLESPKEFNLEFCLYLYFSKNGTPTYKIFPNEKAKNKHQATLKKQETIAISTLLDSFICYYVPSSKDIITLYDNMLLPFIKTKIAQELNDKALAIKLKLDEVADNLNAQLDKVNIGHLKVELSIPDESITNMLSSFSFNVSDPNKTSIDKKGMGIQAATMLASFSWITKEEKKNKKSVIWLIEEPESYLHPELAESCNKIIKNLQHEALIVLSTHSLTFVNQDPLAIVGTHIGEDKTTKIVRYKTFLAATSAIRNALGVKFSDYYNLGLFNCFVEGKSDRELFLWALNRIPATGSNSWEYTRQAVFLDFDGVSGIEPFMKATYAMTHKERAIVVIVDGDDAGQKMIRNLQGFFGNTGVSFQSNKEFISLPTGFTVEGMFPESWLEDAYKNHSGWFSCFSCDMNNKLQSFAIKDTKKSAVQQYLKSKAEKSTNHNDWAEKFITLFDLVNNVLSEKTNKLLTSP